jgi:uncharacterized membrane protein
MFWHGLGSIAFWVLVAVAIAALVRMFMRGRFDGPYQAFGGRGYGGQSYGAGPAPYGPAGPAPRHMSWPEQILAQRLTRGAISENEFREQMAALHAETQHPGNPTAEPS